MAVPKRDIRGLQQIRTLSGSVDRTVIPYKAYMKLSALEMEKARRGIERKSAEKRIKEIDVRLEKMWKRPPFSGCWTIWTTIAPVGKLPVGKPNLRPDGLRADSKCSTEGLGNIKFPFLSCLLNYLLHCIKSYTAISMLPLIVLQTFQKRRMNDAYPEKFNPYSNQ